MAMLENVLASAHRLADRVVAPSTRKEILDNIKVIGAEHPIMFTFVVAQFLFAFIPLFLFVSFVLGVLCLALISSLFWIGLGAIVLGCCLFVTFGFAVTAWLWAVSAFVAGRFVYNLFRGGRRKSSMEKWEEERKKKIMEDRPRVATHQQRNGAGGTSVVNGDGHGEHVTTPNATLNSDSAAH